MADEKTYTEAEHIAILSDRLTKETADLTAERDQLSSVKTELETKLDVAEGAKVAAEQRAVEAEAALTEYKGEVEREREAAAKKDTRLAELREAAAHLDDEFFNDEKRVTRVVAMSDEDFQGYLADLGATNTVTPKAPIVPRETAMQTGGAPAAPAGEAGVNARSVLLGRYNQGS